MLEIGRGSLSGRVRGAWIVGKGKGYVSLDRALSVARCGIFEGVLVVRVEQSRIKIVEFLICWFAGLLDG